MNVDDQTTVLCPATGSAAPASRAYALFLIHASAQTWLDNKVQAVRDLLARAGWQVSGTSARRAWANATYAQIRHELDVWCGDIGLTVGYSLTLTPEGQLAVSVDGCFDKEPQQDFSFLRSRGLGALALNGQPGIPAQQLDHLASHSEVLGQEAWLEEKMRELRKYFEAIEA